jgi:hypothetical protein
MTKVVIKYTLASFTNRFNLARVLEVLQKTQTSFPVDENNSYIGYYEIDDIMSFSPAPFERTRKNYKSKKRHGLFHEQITQIVE